MKTLRFLPQYFCFNPGLNFTIRRGKITGYKEKEMVYLVDPDGLYPAHEAKITRVEHMRLCNINSLKYWHLHQWWCNPCAVMRDCYTDFVDMQEMVTLIWFVIEG